VPFPSISLNQKTNVVSDNGNHLTFNTNELGTFGGLYGQPTDNANLNTALAGKLSVNGGTINGSISGYAGLMSSDMIATNAYLLSGVKVISICKNTLASAFALEIDP
jgi:hypothetical protein